MNGRQLRKKKIRKVFKELIVIIIILSLLISGYNIIRGMTYQRIDDLIILETGGSASYTEGPEVSTKHVYELTYWDIMHGTSVRESSLLTYSGVFENIENIGEKLSSYMSDFYMIEAIDVNRSASFKINEYLEILKKVALVKSDSAYSPKDKGLDISDQKVLAGLISENIGIGEEDIYTGKDGKHYTPLMEFSYAPLLKTSILKYIPAFGIGSISDITGEEVSKGVNQAGKLTLSKYHISSSIRKSMDSVMDSNLRSYMTEDKCYQVTYIPTQNGKKLVLLSAKLSKLVFTNDDSVRAYSKQLANIMDFLKTEQSLGNYVIASIDMNTTKDVIGGEKGVFGIEVKSSKSISANRTGDGILYDVNAFESAFSDSFEYEVNGDVEPNKTISDYIPEGYNVTCPRIDGDDSSEKVHAFYTTTNIEIVGTKVITTETDLSEEYPVQLRFMLY